MSIFEKDFLMRAVRALGRALAGVAVRHRAGVMVQPSKTGDAVDDWLAKLKPEDVLQLDIDVLLKEAGVRTERGLRGLIDALHMPADDGRDPRVAAQRERLVVRLEQVCVERYGAPRRGVEAGA